MRYIVYGAGAVGSAVGGRLFASGQDVLLVARGAHHDALVRNGLCLSWPHGVTTIEVPVVATIAEAAPGAGDVVVLAMKSQDTEAALEALAEVTDRRTAVFCLQNGVENERRALRRFERVYGVCVVLPATYVEPGRVDVHATPLWGTLDLGRYPEGVDDCCRKVATDLETAGFASGAVTDVLRWKYGKLLINLGNALEAACGREALRSGFARRLDEEGRACLARAGIEVVTDEENQARRELVRFAAIGGRPRLGSSTWQGLARGAATTEADYLNGEIVLLGRLHGVPTPANAIVQQVSRRMAAERRSPGSVSLDELTAELAAALDGQDG